MPLKKGNTNIGAIYKGTTQIAKIYKGTTLLFENAKWLDYLFNYLYHSLIPTTIDNKTVQDKAKLTKISGNGVVENQLVSPFDNTGWSSDIGTYAMVNDRKATITLTTNTGSSYSTLLRVYANGSAYTNIVPPNHKVLVSFKLTSTKVSSGSNAVYIGNGNYKFNFTIENGVNYIRGIINYTGTATDANSVISLDLTNTNYAVGDVITIEDYEVIDLTLMFGTGNEPTTLTDNRIQALLNRGYIAYNTGSYKNSRVSEIECEPYNLFDGELELGAYQYSNGEKTSNTGRVRNINPISVVGGRTYKLEKGNANQLALFEYDENMVMISFNNEQTATSADYTLSNRTKFVNFFIFSSTDTEQQICFHLTDTRTGYAPYQAPTKITLNGLLELNGAINSHDTFDITNAGYVFTRNIGVVDLGSLSWNFLSNYKLWLGNLSTIKNFSVSEVPNILSEKYPTNSYNNALFNNMYCIGVSNQNLGIYKDSADDGTTEPSGTLVYELATPQVVTIPKKHLGCVDLGSLSWNYQSTDKVFWVKLTGKALNSTNIYCERYINGSWAVDKTISTDNYAGGTTNEINIHDTSYTSTSALKSALAGVYLFYETENEVADLDNIAQINAGGSITSNWFSWVENQLNNPTPISQTINGLVFTNNEDGSYTVNGTATADTTKAVGGVFSTIIGHYYLICGCASGGSNSTYHLLEGYTYRWNDTDGNGHIQNATTGGNASLIIDIKSGTTCNNLVFKPQFIDLTLGFGEGKEPTSINDPRIQYIIKQGYIPTNTAGTEESIAPEVLPNVNFEIKCK